MPDSFDSAPAARSSCFLWVDLTQEAGAGLLDPIGGACGICRVREPTLIQRAIEFHAPLFLCFEFDQPDTPGITALARTRREHPSLPVLMITGGHSVAVSGSMTYRISHGRSSARWACARAIIRQAQDRLTEWQDSPNRMAWRALGFIWPNFKENVMDRRMVSKGLMLLAATSFGIAPISAWAGDDHDDNKNHEHHGGEARSSVTVSFGAGLNTAQPGNAANHHILPREIKVRKDGVVNFVVAGFHQPVIYFPGVTTANIALPPATSLFINFDLPHAFYVGIAPAGGPPPGNPATAEPSNASNRVESVSFPEVGDYLVICNVRPHFVDGMWAIVKVR